MSGILAYCHTSAARNQLLLCSSDATACWGTQEHCSPRLAIPPRGCICKNRVTTIRDKQESHMPRLLENTLMAVRTYHQRLLLTEKWRVGTGSCGIRTSQRSPMRSDCSSYQPVYRTTPPRMLMHSVPGAGQTATSRTGAPRNQPARAEPDTTCCSLCDGQGERPIGLFLP